MFSRNTLFILVAGVALCLIGLVGCATEDATCTAAPACNKDDQPVEDCPAGATCYEATACEISILCEEHIPDDCDETPECPDATLEVAACESESDCQEVTVCEETIFCRDDVVCDQPSCPNTSESVEFCEGDGCTLLEGCEDTTVYCQDSTTCTGIPTCPGDEIEVDECPPDATCQTVEECDAEIICMSPPILCDDISCPEGFSTAVDYEACAGVEIEDGAHCLTGEVCGDDVFCRADTDADCQQAYHVCPGDYAAVEDCDPATTSCFFATICTDAEWCSL